LGQLVNTVPLNEERLVFIRCEISIDQQSNR
jgi:hypothetical protein